LFIHNYIIPFFFLIFNGLCGIALNEILDAEGEFTVNQAPNGAYFLEKTLPDGRGVRINMDGTFKGFIDQ